MLLGLPEITGALLGVVVPVGLSTITDSFVSDRQPVNVVKMTTNNDAVQTLRMMSFILIPFVLVDLIQKHKLRLIPIGQKCAAAPQLSLGVRNQDDLGLCCLR